MTTSAAIDGGGKRSTRHLVNVRTTRHGSQ
jgi:hypothetical protein